MDTVWIEFVLIAVGIIANGFFAGSEIALVSARPSRLAQLRDAGITGAETALRLKETPESFLATIQIAITAVGTLASAVGGAAAVEALTPTLIEMGVSAAWAGSLALAIVIVVITYFSLVIGELAPKSIALRAPERIACLVARPIAWISRRTASVVRLLTISTNTVLRVLGIGATQESPFVSEDEVRYLVSEGAAKGIFERTEEELVHSAFEFTDTTVREIMVPRTAIKGLDADTPPSEVLAKASEIGHSRIPVYRGSIEHPVGTLVIKDLLAAAARGVIPPLTEMVHPPVFVPETSKISALLQEFRRRRQKLALVVDEYGGVVGLVTVTDVLEEIVGDIPDERETPAAWFAARQPDGSIILDAAAPIEEVRERLGLRLSDSSRYTTVAGLLIDSLGAIPTPGTVVHADGYRWTVLEVHGPRIVKVQVHPNDATGDGASGARTS